MSDAEPRLYGGRYELHRRVARGGMADVYLARDTLLDRPVALKALFPEFATDPSFVERFRREAQAAANLNHSNIVSVYDWGEADGTYFIVMEYVEGRTLSQIVRDEGPLQPDRAADVAIDVAAALGFAHRNGVVHRDVKPGNVLVSPIGQVKVADFGIARAVSTRENLTQTGTVMGTATYFSPEQARGETVDPRSDVYSLGVVLYELLCGEPPFSGDSPVAVAYKHVSETPMPLRQRNPLVPEALEAVTMRALAKNPANRYASADELADDLRRFRAGQPVLAESILPEQMTQAVAAATMVGADATRAVPAASTTQVTGQVDERFAPQGSKRSPVFLVILVLLLLGLAALVGMLAANLDLGAEEPPETVIVPTVLKLQEADAIRRLEGSGLEVAVVREANAAEEGTVFEQNPGAGEEVDEGDEVTIKVASTRPDVEMPSLVGKTRAEAETLLRERSLVPDFEQEESDKVEPDRVISQDPVPGTKVKPDSEVEVVISAGVGEAPVPDVRGRKPADAANVLGRAGFQSSTRTEAAADVGPGDVIGTDPPAGTVVPKSQVIVIRVSTGAPTTTTTTTSSSTTSTTGG